MTCRKLNKVSNMNKSISILVTGVAWKPLGGLKVIYEYANKLVEEGAKIDIYYAASSDFGQYSISLKIKSVIKYIFFRRLKSYKCESWFKLNSKIEEHLVWKLTEKSVGKYGCYIATTIQSAIFLSKFSNTENSKKYYFIQDFENWSYGINDNIVYESFCYPMKKIVIANWLKSKVESVGQTCHVVHNGFDPVSFHITIPIENRKKTQICMMYNTKFSKGCEDCFKALDIVKKQVPELRVNIFGIPPRPVLLPDWYYYTQLPSTEQLRNLYNISAIFVGASHTEGWGLTIGEAMMCGCAVVCTNNDGYIEMAHDNQTALVSDIKDPEQLAYNIIKLITRDEIRITLARNANEFIKSLDLSSSYYKFREAIGWNLL